MTMCIFPIHSMRTDLIFAAEEGHQKFSGTLPTIAYAVAFVMTRLSGKVRCSCAIVNSAPDTRGVDGEFMCFLGDMQHTRLKKTKKRSRVSRVRCLGGTLLLRRTCLQRARFRESSHLNAVWRAVSAALPVVKLIDHLHLLCSLCGTVRENCKAKSFIMLIFKERLHQFIHSSGRDVNKYQAQGSVTPAVYKAT